MPLYLEILIGILVCLAIVLAVVMIVAFVKFSKTTKKFDYLVEDITYKSEILSPTIDSLVKLGKLVDVFDEILREKTKKISKLSSDKKESLYIEVKEAAKQAKKQIKNKK